MVDLRCQTTIGTYPYPSHEPQQQGRTGEQERASLRPAVSPAVGQQFIEPINLNVTGPLGTQMNYTQTFGPSSHKLSVAEQSGRDTNYGYDSIYRPASESIAGDPTASNNGALTYSLDPVGNRLSLASTLAALPPQTFAYDPDERISGDAFDANGNALTPGTEAVVLGVGVAVACYGEPIVAGLGMAALAASGYEIYNVQATGTCPIIMTFSWRDRVQAIPRPAPKQQPLTCTPQEQQNLEALKDAACGAAKGSCTSKDSCLVIGQKLVAKTACINARIDVMTLCYGGGDSGHLERVDNLAVEIGKCLTFQATCKP